MKFGYSEDEVHAHIYAKGIEALIVDSKELDDALSVAMPVDEGDGQEGGEFAFWKIIKQRVLERIQRIHCSVRHGRFIGSKVKLPIDRSRPMELDLLGAHDDGIFVLELKVDRSSERNAFSELLAYSHYIAQMFAMSGPEDITNVLVAPMDVKITRQAFLYDLIVTNRNVIVYNPVLKGSTLDSLELQLFVPTDEEFRFFANRLLSHDAMACVVASFPDLDGWYDSKGSSVNDYTKKFLGGLAGYASQLMEAEQLHGFAYIRKYWPELPFPYKNALILCAINPFLVADPDRANAITEQLSEDGISALLESPEYSFYGRVIRLAQRAIADSLAHGQRSEIELPHWPSMIRSIVETATCTNFAFRPTGLFREAYVAHINRLHEQNSGGQVHDLSRVKGEDINNWLKAWMFMEMCGFDDSQEMEEENME
ncbi:MULTISPECIES: hypothetical protein [Stenotrophomonas maltophilia group]|uniref:hypothetical protein n=1 Tax=Stenotrophomonas maltophilia group TaxID=995085 RepID=UPI000DA85081|nr:MULTISPECIES: hypothetical protein [Stenotrophomonas maltophilia group]MCZ7845829.1 hypothetical protein [Stenotrophomonas maltophilia]MDJ1625419.1 hypothetical protein [Stenotrophomonas sepilia]PZT38674.1 hypothetical protein A7X97_09170 [Stenotrophomonas sepilia]